MISLLVELPLEVDKSLKKINLYGFNRSVVYKEKVCS